MVKTVGKFGLLLLCVCLLSAAPVFADSTTTFTFTSTLGSIGTTDTFTSGGLSLVATGYSSPGVTTDMWAKNLGPDENGIGLTAGIVHEISGSMFIQLNLANILAASPSGITLSLGSIQSPDAYNVWGSNTAGTPGTLLASNQTGLSFPLADLGAFTYISISASAPTDSILLDDVEVTTAPEPNSATLLLYGLMAFFGVGTLAKKLFV